MKYCTKSNCIEEEKTFTLPRSKIDASIFFIILTLVFELTKTNLKFVLINRPGVAGAVLQTPS